MSPSTTTLADRIKNLSAEGDQNWGRDYGWLAKIIDRDHLKVGAEIGVAFGGHAESILKESGVERLYGIDPYTWLPGYDDPMNLPQADFDELYRFTLDRLARFGDRYLHVRKSSKDAVGAVPELDFIYIDADHSYGGVLHDLCSWYPKVRVGGVIAGHDYDHPCFPGVKQAIDEFFRRFGWQVNFAGEYVWWARKQPVAVSFIMPAYNCGDTIEESIACIVQGNIGENDEIVVVDDGSTDGTADKLKRLRAEHPAINVLSHSVNRGGGAARNTAVNAARNQLIFCLDSDNVLAPGSVQNLKEFLESSGADVAAFQEVRYFKETKETVTHKWTFKERQAALADHLSEYAVPGASGNYLYTKESWHRAGGYPEFAKALDAWGFGFRQLATGSKMMVMPDSHYFHRYGYDSYWVRESKKKLTSLTATQIIIPFIDLINEKDVDYMLGRRGRNSWFDNLEKRPIRVKEPPAAKPALKPTIRLKRRVKAVLGI